MVNGKRNKMQEDSNHICWNGNEMKLEWMFYMAYLMFSVKSRHADDEESKQDGSILCPSWDVTTSTSCSSGASCGHHQNLGWVNDHCQQLLRTNNYHQ